MAPAQYLLVGLFQCLANIHQQDHTTQRLPRLQVVRDISLPLAFHGLGYLGIAVARQVNQPDTFADLKKIDLAGTSGGFADARQCTLPGQHVQGAGLAGIGTPGKGHFHTAVRWRTPGIRCPQDETCLLVGIIHQTH